MRKSFLLLSAAIVVLSSLAVAQRPQKVIGAGEGAVWVASEGSNVFGGRVESAVWRIDPERNEVVATIEVTDPVGLAVGEGAVWIAQSGPGSVTRIDPATNRVASEIEIGANLGGIAAGEGSVWVTDDRAHRCEDEPSRREVHAGPAAPRLPRPGRAWRCGRRVGGCLGRDLRMRRRCR